MTKPAAVSIAVPFAGRQVVVPLTDAERATLEREGEVQLSLLPDPFFGDEALRRLYFGESR